MFLLPSKVGEVGPRNWRWQFRKACEGVKVNRIGPKKPSQT